MNKNILISLLIVILAIILFSLVLFPAYKYSVNLGGLTIQSNEYNPADYVSSLAEKSEFIILPEMPEQGAIRSYMGNAMNLFIVVLEGNRKDTIQLIRVVDSENNLLYCVSNLGDLKTSEELSAEDCVSFYESRAGSVKVFINLPKEGNSVSATLNENTIILDTGSYSQVGSACLILLKAMFSNAETVLDTVNALTGALS